MTPRARPMTPEDRREALVDATIPLLHEHGRSVTTKLIADAAGVAEGTIFRVFESKDELVDAALDHAFDDTPFLAGLRDIDPDQTLRDLVRAIVELFQDRYRGIFGLMTAVGMAAPPRDRQNLRPGLEEAVRIMTDLIAPHAAELAVPVEEFVHITRLLTFSGSHPHVCAGRTLTAEEIVTTVLDGLHRKDS
ncbi:TetR/AcrR family transcriptional regulator [Nocardioides sp. T5]|uniref:TetR/AcrR family transcriptional regulator n=1 Tax=Nocardioides sp. T5 TaxID=3400182 RepID=UPI003A8790A4